MAPGTDGRVPIRRALLSVDDKSGIVEIARTLLEFHVELIATGSTRAHLEKAGVSARAAEELTGVGSWFGGRIKTLHPGLLGGILAPRTTEGVAELERRGLLPIDLVVVNLYPYAAHAGAAPGEREEYIDVGGVTLLRAAAKNHHAVAVVSSPSQYGRVEHALREGSGALSPALMSELAVDAYRRTAEYDATIAATLVNPPPGSTEFPNELTFRREPMRLRYGENPHQAAAVYRMSAPVSGMPAPDVKLLKGQPLSYTNLLDLDTAVGIVAEFVAPSAAVVKHATPCGAASAPTLRAALDQAIATDPVARYGCVIAVNRPVDADDVEAFRGVFVDLLAAPGFTPEARTALGRREKIKLVELPGAPSGPTVWEAHSALGRLLVQESDRRELGRADLRLVTTTPATDDEMTALNFAWRVVRHAKSNAAVLAVGTRTVGIGSGQPTRVKAVEIAVEVAGERARGSVLGSDAFFPFADGIEVAGGAGVRVVVQPGGSVRDPEVTETANRWKMSMYFTGWRVFRH